MTHFSNELKRIKSDLKNGLLSSNVPSLYCELVEVVTETRCCEEMPYSSFDAFPAALTGDLSEALHHLIGLPKWQYIISKSQIESDPLESKEHYTYRNFKKLDALYSNCLRHSKEHFDVEASGDNKGSSLLQDISMIKEKELMIVNSVMDVIPKIDLSTMRNTIYTYDISDEFLTPERAASYHSAFIFMSVLNKQSEMTGVEAEMKVFKSYITEMIDIYDILTKHFRYVTNKLKSTSKKTEGDHLKSTQH